MTKTFDLTENETRALLVMVTDCLAGMGGKRPLDLDNDPYTWTDARVLMKAGWSKSEANGTLGALIEKRAVDQVSKSEWAVTEEAYRFADTLWDTYQQGLAKNVNQPQEAPTVTDTPAYTLDLTDIAVSHGDQGNGASLITIRSQEDLAQLSGPQLVAFFNTVKGADVAEVKKFSSKEAATKRLWAALQALPVPAQPEPEPVANRQTEGAGTEVKSEVIAKAARKGTGINLQPKAKVYACREGSKQATLVDMLFRPEGATMAELLDALSGGTPWKEVTVKSGLNWDMNKVKGYGIRTTKRGDLDCYHLVLPEGMTAPVPHQPRKAKKGE